MKRHLILLLIPLLIACQKDQFGQVVGVDFKTSALCETDTQNVQFTNARTTPILIEGASISAGTNPVGNFSLISVTVDGQVFTSSGGGTIADVTIPAGSTYTFQMRYTPKTNYTTETVLEHEAVLDVSLSREAGAVHSPVGVQQIQLSGTVEQQATIEGCTNFSEGEEVSFDGAVTLQVDSILAVTGKLSEPLDSNQGIRPFEPALLDLTLNRTASSATVAPIAAGEFVLPQAAPDVPVLGNLVTQDTIITTDETATGSYNSSNGTLIIRDLEVTLDGDFTTTITVTLTTEEISIAGLSPPLHPQALPAFGDHYDVVGRRIFGSRIDAEGNITLVGTTKIIDFTLDDVARGSQLEELGGTTMGLLITGKIITE